MADREADDDGGDVERASPGTRHTRPDAALTTPTSGGLRPVVERADARRDETSPARGGRVTTGTRSGVQTDGALDDEENAMGGVPDRGQLGDDFSTRRHREKFRSDW